VRLKLPHPLVLLLGGVAVAVLLTWVLPAGQFERRVDDATGRSVVIPDTYARVDPTPVGLMPGLLAVPRGIVEGADVILIILFVGGAFAMLERTGALARLVGALVGHSPHPWLVVVLVSVVFATLGALENMHEEIIALVPVLLVLSRGLGFGPLTALAMSLGAAVVAAAFGPTNPFQTGIALQFAELPPMSQPALRFSLLVAAVSVWVGWTLVMSAKDERVAGESAIAAEPVQRRDFVLLALVLLPFVPYVIGVLRHEWGFNELPALFLVAAFAIGLVSGQTPSDSAASFIKGMEGMLGAALFVGVARGISVALADGQVLDTILHGLATPLTQVPGVTAAVLMVPMQALLHIPVPTMSGQAVLTMPVVAPLADLLGFSRDASVIAFQTGAGLCDMLTPTNGALLAMILSAKITYGRWLRFALPGALLVAIVGLIGIVLAG